MKISFIPLLGAFLFGACSMTIDSEEIIAKYRKHPKKDGMRAAIIEEEILPAFKEEAPYQLKAIAYAKQCFSQAANTEEANTCREKIVAKFGNEFDFTPFRTWDEAKKERVMRFLRHNEEALTCYMQAKKADDVAACKDPIDPDF